MISRPAAPRRGTLSRKKSKKIIPLSKCSICSEIPNGAGANWLEHEALPPAAWKLTGMPDNAPGSGMHRTVQCPECGVWYEFDVETGFMEYDATTSTLLLNLFQARKMVKCYDERDSPGQDFVY